MQTFSHLCIVFYLHHLTSKKEKSSKKSYCACFFAWFLTLYITSCYFSMLDQIRGIQVKLESYAWYRNEALKLAKQKRHRTELRPFSFASTWYLVYFAFSRCFIFRTTSRKSQRSSLRLRALGTNTKEKWQDQDHANSPVHRSRLPKTRFGVSSFVISLKEFWE